MMITFTYTIIYLDAMGIRKTQLYFGEFLQEMVVIVVVVVAAALTRTRLIKCRQIDVLGITCTYTSTQLTLLARSSKCSEVSC